MQYDLCKNYISLLTLDSIIMPHVFENIMENGAFALLEQMLHFQYFQKYSKLNLNFSRIFSMLS